MAKHHTLELSENERQQLIELRDNGEPAYLRETRGCPAKNTCGFFSS